VDSGDLTKATAQVVEEVAPEVGFACASRLFTGIYANFDTVGQDNFCGLRDYQTGCFRDFLLAVLLAKAPFLGPEVGSACASRLFTGIYDVFDTVRQDDFCELRDYQIGCF